MNRNQTQMGRIARVLALVLAFALIASSAFYLIMAIAGPMYAFEGGPFVYGADEAAEPAADAGAADGAGFRPVRACFG